MIQEPRLSAGLEQYEANHAVMPLPPGVTLGPKTTLIIAVESARFSDGTEWRPSAGEVSARVHEKALQLKLE